MATRKKGSSNNGRNAQQERRGMTREQEQLDAQLSERATELAEHAEYLTQRAQQMAAQADHRFRQTVEHRPMTSVWTSFGIGVGLGLALVALMPGGRRGGGWSVGDWSLDELSDSLHDLPGRVGSAGRSAARRASHTAHDLGDRASDYAHDLGDAATRRAREAAGYLGF